MNVERLNIVLAAIRCGSLTKAAEELGYTQSGLTYAINSLERELGISVVIRDTYGIRLSKDGEELLPYIEDMIECERRFTSRARDLLARRGNVLNVAAYPSIATSILPEILADFNRVCPGVNINLEVCSRDDIIDSLRDGSCDFGFGGRIYLSSCEWMPLFKDPELAVMPDDFPTDGMEAFPMEEFRKHPFARPLYWAEEQDIAKQIEAYGIEPQFVVNAYDNGPILAMVEQGLALSSVPKLTLTSNVRIKTLPLDPPCYRLLGVNYRQDCTENSAASKFLKCLSRRQYREEQ